MLYGTSKSITHCARCPTLRDESLVNVHVGGEMAEAEVGEDADNESFTH